jgi:type III restriction enzyme
MPSFAQNIPGDEMPMFRNLWENIRKDMPKKGRGKNDELDPLKLPTRLKTAMEALYGHYEKTTLPTPFDVVGNESP